MARTMRYLLVAGVVLALFAVAQSIAAQESGKIDQEVLDEILVVDERSPYGFARSPYGPGALAAGPFDVYPYQPGFGLPYGNAP